MPPPPAGVVEGSIRMMDNLDILATENFREYLRIPSVHPDVNYGKLRMIFF